MTDFSMRRAIELGRRLAKKAADPKDPEAWAHQINLRSLHRLASWMEQGPGAGAAKLREELQQAAKDYRLNGHHGVADQPKDNRRRKGFSAE